MPSTASCCSIARSWRCTACRPTSIRVGVSMRDVIDHVAERGYFPEADARAGVAAAAGEDGAAQAVPAVPEPAQRQRIHPALSPDGRRRLGDAVRGRDRAPSHGARTAPAVRALRPGDHAHVARAVHVRSGRAADRLQRALSRHLRARSRGHQAGRHASRTARALDRERQRARHVGRGVLREAQGRGRPAGRSRPCCCT